MKTYCTVGRGIVWGMIIGLAVNFDLLNSSITMGAKVERIISRGTPVPKPSSQDIDLLKRESRVFNYIAQTVSASVVHITSEILVKPNPESNEGWLRQFFPDQEFRKFFQFPQQQPKLETGLGSGAVIDPDGYIVTNNHVVDGAQKIRVVFPDGREFTPQWVRTDPPSDLALIKIEATDLPALTFADSDQARVGDIVLAVGNPFGLDNTVTEGIISYLGRFVPVGSSISYTNYIQTDAAINPGNSGGPLVDLDGRIVGLNSAILSNTSSYAGIGFAIPSNTAKFVVDQLKRSEHVTRSYLGVQIQDLTPSLAQHFGRENDRGTLITSVLPHSPAAKAKLAVGDIILKVNDQPVLNGQQLQNRIAEFPPGAQVTFEIWRDKKAMTVPVTLEKMGKGFFARRPAPSKEEVPEENQAPIKELGIAVATLNEELAQKYHYHDLQGAVIIDLDPQGEGAQAGLEQGDLIVMVQNQKVTSAQGLVNLLKKYPLQQGVAMLVRSPAGGSRFVYVKVE